MEKLAADAERSSIKYKQVQFLTDKIGQEFDGKISGVTEWGIFVEIIENHCEGMIRQRDLTDDQYFFDEDNYCMRGKKYGKVLTLGDEVRIEVKRADLIKKQLDFALVEVAEKPGNNRSSESNRRPQSNRPQSNNSRPERSKPNRSQSGKKTEPEKAEEPEKEEDFTKPRNERFQKKNTANKPKESGDKNFNDEWGFEI
jgi:predicted RNA-binding protein with RPS1 domain